VFGSSRIRPGDPIYEQAKKLSYELARIPTIHPQRWDIPMDWVVTERGVYRRDPEGLAFLGEPAAGDASTLASPVCYAAEIDPTHFGDRQD
jgi:hypothetical protein